MYVVGSKISSHIVCVSCLILV